MKITDKLENWCFYIPNQLIILTSAGKTPPFYIQTGILQGDTLASFLFIIVADYVLRMFVDTNNDKGFQIIARNSSPHRAQYLTDCDFADNIALISNSLENVHSLTSVAWTSIKLCRSEYANLCTINKHYGIKTLTNTSIKLVNNDSKYLGSSHISSS